MGLRSYLDAMARSYDAAIGWLLLLLLAGLLWLVGLRALAWGMALGGLLVVVLAVAVNAAWLRVIGALDAYRELMKKLLRRRG